MSIALAQHYVETLLTEALPSNRIYHNLQHTRTVVQAVEKIASAMEISSQSKEIILLAAWFHDTGHTQVFEGHEAVSQEIAWHFLKVQAYETNVLQQIIDCIGATKMPQTPQNSLEAVMCDGDLPHLASTHFQEDAERLRREWQLVLNKHYTDKEWLQQNIDFFQQHTYHSVYGKNILSPLKQQNIEHMRIQLSKL